MFPWGISASIHAHLKQSVLKLRKSMIVFKMLPDISFYFSLCLRSLCHTLFNTLDMSKNIALTATLSSKDLINSTGNRKIWLAHEPRAPWNYKRTSITCKKIPCNITCETELASSALLKILIYFEIILGIFEISRILIIVESLIGQWKYVFINCPIIFQQS